MKYVSSFLISCFILSTLIPYHINADRDPKTIQHYEADITGDGKKEDITLKGTLLAEDSSFYQNIWVDIENEQNAWTIAYGGGYRPNMDVFVLNHNQTTHLLYSSQSESDATTTYALHAFEKGKMVKKPLPSHQYIHGKFQDDFKVVMSVTPAGQTETVTIDPKTYIENGLYTDDGRLVQPISAQVQNPTIEKHYISKQQGYGLKITHTVTEPINDQVLGTIETRWYFEHDKWIILNNTLTVK